MRDLRDEIVAIAQPRSRRSAFAVTHRSICASTSSIALTVSKWNANPGVSSDSPIWASRVLTDLRQIVEAALQ